MQMRATDRTGPSQRRDPEREDDARDPLEAHQAGEQPVGAPIQIGLVLVKELAGAASDEGGSVRHSTVKSGEQDRLHATEKTFSSRGS